MQGTLDLRRLRYFLTIVEQGSLSAAARTLNVAQPALSYHVAELERTTGLSLLERGHEGVRVTAEGEVLRRHAAEIVERTERAERELARLARKHTRNGRLRVAIITSLAAELTPLLVRHIAGSDTAIELGIIEAGTREIQSKLGRKLIDMAICLTPSEHTGTEPIAHERLWFVAPQGHAGADPIAFADLAHSPMVLPAHGNPLRAFMDAAARQQGLHLNVALEVDGAGSRLNAVINGIGATVLGPHSIPASDGRFQVRSVAAPGLRRPIYLGRRAGVDPGLARRMEEALRSALSELGLQVSGSG